MLCYEHKHHYRIAMELHTPPPPPPSPPPSDTELTAEQKLYWLNALQVVGDWSVHDDGDGRLFYYDRRTDSSQWEVPDGLASLETEFMMKLMLQNAVARSGFGRRTTRAMARSTTSTRRRACRCGSGRVSGARRKLQQPQRLVRGRPWRSWQERRRRSKRKKQRRRRRRRRRNTRSRKAEGEAR